MAHKNYEDDWDTKISLIRTNLKEGRYQSSGGIFPIVKELVQNAEDSANVSRLMIVKSDGLHTANHPLLRGPALLAINDGAFDVRTDGRAIRKLGLSSKTADCGSIGKFGLGMKSIFQLCEMFFYIAIDPNGNRTLADFINPWSTNDGGFHPDWDEFTEEDRESVECHVKQHFGLVQSFCLWIPLRQSQHCNGNPIEKDFPGDIGAPALLGREQLACVPTLFPLLNRLTVIELGLQSDATHLFRVAAGSSRLQPRQSQPSMERTQTYKGKVALDGRDSTKELTYAGMERCTKDPMLDRVSKHDKWPESLFTDPTTGRSLDVPEKALPHSAACWVAARSDGANGELRVHWAVFLPLGRPESTALPKVGWSIDLFLHGWFFPNSGRTAIEAIDDELPEGTAEIIDSAGVRRAWNQRLARHGTLPLVPQALAGIARNCNWDSKTTHGVTKGLQDSRLYQRFVKDICLEHAWLCRFTTDERLEWISLIADCPYHELPSHRSYAFINSLFPALKSLAHDNVFVLHDHPRLTASEPVRLTASAGTELLRSIAPESLFSMPGALEYLERFLDMSAVEGAWEVHENELVTLARTALAAQLGVIDAPAKPRIRAFLARVPPSRRILLDLSESIQSDASEVLRGLEACTSSVVWTTRELEPKDAPSQGAIGSHEAFGILCFLSTQLSRKVVDGERDFLGLIAAQVIRATRDKESLKSRAGEQQFFSGRDLREKREVKLSWNHLTTFMARRRLFVRTPALSSIFQDALGDDTVYLVSQSVLELLFDATPSCGISQILEALSGSNPPVLAPPAKREGALKHLLMHCTGTSEREQSAVRYVLHGQLTQFGTRDRLYKSPGSSNGSGVWARITRTALRHRHEEWKVVDDALARMLTEPQCEAFLVDTVGPDSAKSLASGIPADCFSELRPTADEYQALLKHIDSEDLLKRLPIHESVDGEFLSIGPRCFWESSAAASIPKAFMGKVSLLRRASDEQTAKRQLQLASLLGSSAVISLALDEPEPSTHWKLIMEHLLNEPRLPASLIDRLKTTVWVPTTSSVPVAPETVVNLPALSDELLHLANEFPESVVGVDRLTAEFKAHSAYEAAFLPRVVPSGDEAVTRLLGVLGSDPNSRVGCITASADEWLIAFEGDNGRLFPRLALLRVAHSKLPIELKGAFTQLRQELSIERTCDILRFLQESHAATRSPSRQSTILHVFVDYLSTLCSKSGGRDVIKHLDLLNEDNHWAPARTLCCANDGIARASVVAHDIEDALGELVADAQSCSVSLIPESDLGIFGSATRDSEAIIRDITSSASRLKEFFRHWTDFVPAEQIGALLAILGDTPEVPELAQSLLGTRTVEGVRNVLDIALDGTRLGKQRIVVEVARDRMFSTRNLFNEPISVPLNERPKTLFVGYRKSEKIPNIGMPVTRVRLNALDLARINDPEFLTRLLRDSTFEFIQNVYGARDRVRFEAHWEMLAETDQADILNTQLRIADLAPHILYEYGLGSSRQLAPALNKWEVGHSLKVERMSQPNAARNSRRNPEAEMNQACSEVRTLLENDCATQAEVLEAVRRKMSTYQYNLSSIPFELFQNADDALVELARPDPGVADGSWEAKAPPFLVLMESQRLAFVHFGRRINQHPFSNDLWKMSLLSLSNKWHADDDSVARVTGKFGLGFKSVFFACDEPRVLSGRLAFSILGGIFPRRLIEDQRSSLNDIRQRFAGDDFQATVVELNLRPELGAEPILERFNQVAHVLVIFSRRLRRCAWLTGDDEVAWQPHNVPRVAGCKQGSSISLTQREGDKKRIELLQFESEWGSLLFCIGARGFEALDDGLPTLWVTAPLDVKLKLGFLVNGRPFAVDVGRAQVATDFSQNDEIARKIGIAFSQQLSALYEALNTVSTRAEIFHSLRLAPDTSTYSIWNSLWERLVVAVDKNASAVEPAGNLVRQLLWGDAESGVAEFVSRHAVIPARLPGPLFQNELTRLGTIRYAVRGALAQGDGFALACVRKWPSVVERLEHGSLVSYDQVYSPLSKLCSPITTHVLPLDLAKVVEWECEGNSIDSMCGERLGELITKSFIETLSDTRERDRLQAVLTNQAFRAEDGHFHDASSLIVRHQNEAADGLDDERMRARFAPRQRVLSREYGRHALAFFLACRGRLSLPVREMASWIRDARDDGVRKAALEYLAAGDQGRALQIELCQQDLGGTWLESLPDSPVFRSLRLTEQNHLVDLLPGAVAARLRDTAIQSSDTRPTFDPRRVLRKIHEWWGQHRKEQVAEYERRVFPNGRLQNLEKWGEPPFDLEARKDWVTLFLLGITHTMGRTVAEQHRGFLRELAKTGRLEMIASSERNPAVWMGWIDTFLERPSDDGQFLHWMRQFVGIYQVSRHLDDYREAFLAAKRFARPFDIPELTNTGDSPALQGGGVSAPRFANVLGMGQCFVLRELLRNGVVDANRFAIPHCYVGSGRVRRLLGDLNCHELGSPRRSWEYSRIIHGFLVRHIGEGDAMFHGDFDIPLQIVAENERLQEQFFQAPIAFTDDEEAEPWLEDQNNLANGA